MDQRKGSLSPEDQSLLAKIHDRFLKSRLAQVPGAALIGTLIGKLLAVAEYRGVNWRAVAVANLPTRIEVARDTWGMTPRDEEALKFSEAHAAQYVTDMAARMKEQVAATVQEQFAAGVPPPQMATALLEEYGSLNRDWRRIALTETANAVSNGYLAQQKAGTLVVGDAAVDCCGWCKEHIQGRAYALVETPIEHPTYEESWHQVWVGKSNVGRSRYPVRQDGSERDHTEVWHPCIPAHPHCRCRWRLFNPAIESLEPGTNRVIDKFKLFSEG